MCSVVQGKLAADEKALDLDLVDFVDMMLATGLRIGNRRQLRGRRCIWNRARSKSAAR